MTKDETPAPEAAKDGTPATEAEKVAESTVKKTVFTVFTKRRSKRRWVAGLVVVSSVITILAGSDEAMEKMIGLVKLVKTVPQVMVIESNIERFLGIESNECSLSMDRLGRREDIETRNDALDDNCPTQHYYSGGEYAQYYGFTLDRKATVTMEMTSRDVDSWLYLRSGSPPGSSEVLERNDDGGAGEDARIERVLDPGNYTIEATTLNPGETGDYTLTVTVDRTEECSLLLMGT